MLRFIESELRTATLLQPAYKIGILIPKYFRDNKEGCSFIVCQVKNKARSNHT